MNKEAEVSKIFELEGKSASINQVYERINFNEIVYKPTRALNFTVNQTLLGSAFEFFLTKCLLAFEGYSGSSIVYDTTGSFRG